MSSTDARVAAAAASLTSDELLRFLSAQRWFGAKGGSPSNARVLDCVVMPWGDGRFALARVGVNVGGATQMYQLPLAARDALPTGVDQRASIKPGLYDAVYDDEFRRGLANALANGARAEAGGVRWAAKPIGRVDVSGDSKVGSAEQSNTSIVFGGAAILKLFRTLQAGVHPDVEVTGFLTTRAGFEHTPKLLATIEFDSATRRLGDSATGGVIVAGMLQEFLPGSIDAWSYALERGKPYFNAPIDRDSRNDFVDDARRLGAITRAMHEALASDDDDPAFAPEDVAPEDVDRWAHRTQQSIRDSLVLLAKQIDAGTFPADRLAEAKALVARRDHYLGWIDEIDDSIGDDLGLRTRVHGDYHLGQVLHTASNDFMIIDFEGEPSRSIEERHEKTSPLRDVAGMLRSFAYAAATLAMEAKNIDPRTREVRIARWERDVRNAYLEGYLGATDEDAAEILPEEDAHVRQLISLFEAEKAFYELAYELNNRPTWAWIPMRGIAKLFLSAK